MVDQVTSARGYQKPHATNQLSYDVGRLRAALDAMDVDVAGLLASVAGKAATGHGHVMDDISGLGAALSGKASVSHSHTLASLTDVSVTGAGSGFVLRYSSGAWQAAALGITDVVNLSATLASMQAAIATMDDGAY